MALLRGRDGFGERHFTAQESARLFVAERIERAAGGSLRRLAILRDQAARFLYQSVGEHLRGALIDAGIKQFAVGVEADAEDAVSSQRIAACLPGLRHRLA